MTRAEAYLHANFHLDPSIRLATIHQRYRQTGQHRQDSSPIAQGEPFYKRLSKNQQFSLLDFKINDACEVINFTHLTNLTLLHYLVKFVTRMHVNTTSASNVKYKIAD